jgi:hypothetical protein
MGEYPIGPFLDLRVGRMRFVNLKSRALAIFLGRGKSQDKISQPIFLIAKMSRQNVRGRGLWCGLVLGPT